MSFIKGNVRIIQRKKLFEFEICLEKLEVIGEKKCEDDPQTCQ
ncbi:hypothetical protein [Marinoscillum sp.]